MTDRTVRRLLARVRRWWVPVVLVQLLAAAKLAEAWATAVVLATVPEATEANPLLLSLFDAVGRVDALLLTSAVAIVVHAALAEVAAWWAGEDARRVALAVPAVVYAAVALWNAHHLL